LDSKPKPIGGKGCPLSWFLRSPALREVAAREIARHNKGRPAGVDVELPRCDARRHALNQLTRGDRNLRGPTIKHFERLDTELREAVKRGDARAMGDLLREGAGVNRADAMGWTPLMFAASAGDVACLRLLLPLANLGKETRAKTTPLLLCVSAGWLEGSRLLLAAMRSVSADEADAGGGYWRVAAAACARRNERKETALMMAAEAGCVDLVRELLPHSNPNAGDADGCTALMRAAKNKREDASCLKELLAASNPSRRDKKGRTALHWAASAVWPEAVEILVDSIDPMARDDSGKSALDLSVDYRSENGERVRQALGRSAAERESREIHAAARDFGVFTRRARRRPLAL
jgi:ankyrin repeat protein